MTLRLWQRHVLTGNDISCEITDAKEAVNDLTQHPGLQVVGICLEKHDSYCNELNEYEFESDCDMSENDMEDHPQHYAQSHSENLDWKKFILVTGKAGRGKTHCL